MRLDGPSPLALQHLVEVEAVLRRRSRSWCRPPTTMCRAISGRREPAAGVASCAAPPGRASRWPGKMRLDHPSPLWASTSAVASPKRSAIELTVSPSATTYLGRTLPRRRRRGRALAAARCAFAFGWRLTLLRRRLGGLGDAEGHRDGAHDRERQREDARGCRVGDRRSAAAERVDCVRRPRRCRPIDHRSPFAGVEPRRSRSPSHRGWGESNDLAASPPSRSRPVARMRLSTSRSRIRLAILVS